MKYKVRFLKEGLEFFCNSDESISHAMNRVNNRHPIVGCRGGGCGICKIKILGGDYELGRMSKAVISECEIGKGYTLACKTYPRSDLLVEFVEK
ncbi:2Fe-2S iron-sulfur cluster-binding protein [Miniphocaeibacter halophilus]|uniref:2Fe-2S iron-sulfur cluster binding domain-containing protein n=1 Tax=Miniphocaeibacter halophilus TaxID=2931922 RepID=A0AC61MPR4_9FIRM|nr:2Fe-2S iron-sulfur cluster-binding protein [Miniphocaeibacter halophilus]QQK07595.1 2Fe-2S iron-sulfur cluster binding domain-containing protein [Miniphocaeibacter halophilus]